MSASALTSSSRPSTGSDVEQGGRPAEEGHGRHASAPWQIPYAGWKDILWRTYARINDDRLLATAAGVVFFALLAVFPAVTALGSPYGLFAEPTTIGANLQSLSLMCPESSFHIVRGPLVSA